MCMVKADTKHIFSRCVKIVDINLNSDILFLKNSNF